MSEITNPPEAGKSPLRELAELNLPGEVYSKVLLIIARMQEAEFAKREAGRKRTAEWRTRQDAKRHGDVTEKSVDKSNGALRHSDSHDPSYLSSSTPSIGKPLSEEVRKEDVSVAGQEFWQRYPLRVGKRAAMQALEKALKRASLVEILAGVDRYVASANPDYYCHPATWLNADRWLDEPKLQRMKGNGNGKGLAELAHDLAQEYHLEFESNSSGSFDDERSTGNR